METNTKVMAICNQKGGVGKTVTTVNLGIGLARQGKRVLLVDVDPQGSLTASLGYQQPDQLDETLATIMGKLIMDEPISPGEGILHQEEGVDLLPANIELATMETTLVNVMSRETVLKQYIESVRSQYDVSAAHMIVPLKNMVNEAYAADISRKVRSQQRQAMQEGQFLGSRPPYGYLKDPQDCHKLVVNPDTAPVVRQIFQWAADGISKNQIVLNLNESGILTPGHYLASIGLITNKRLMGSGVWQTRTLDVILNDDVYMGDMVQGKTRSVGHHKQVPVEPEQWVVVRNTHEPIISRKLFESAHKARKEMAQKYTYAAKKSYTNNILKGKIFCGGCGTALHWHRVSSGEGYCYYCLTNYRARKGACSAKSYITEARLFEIVMGIIRQKAEVVLGDRLRMKQYDSRIAEEMAEIDREIACLNQQARKSKVFLTRLYENLVNGILTQEEYLEMRDEYSQEIDGALEGIHRLQARQSELNRQRKSYSGMADKLAAIDTDTELTAQLVDAIIERITVNGPEDIFINFRFESEFDELMGVLGDE